MSGNHVTKVLFKVESCVRKESIVFLIKKKLTLILKALLNPEAKKPPKGPIMELNRLREIECQM